jgi:REP element-mobilizing transposase RayT
MALHWWHRPRKQNAGLAIGGIEDHVHLLLSIPSTLSIAKAMQLIKGGSSSWVHDTFPEHHEFEWQEGYGAFSIGVSQVPDTKAYIDNQREHHRTKTFREEFMAFLERHGVDYDPGYVWG